MRIAVDAMGGDHAPEPIVKGTVEALKSDPDLHVTLVGDQDQIEPHLEDLGDAAARVDFAHTTEVVGMHESAAKAYRSKPKSSINLCWNLLAEGRVEGLVSAGHTGAVVAGGYGTRRFLRNVQRPGIAVTLPTPTGWSVMVDVGANPAPKPEHLFQYGVMGMTFARQLLGQKEPSLGLLNIGSEDSKGNSLAKQTASLFQSSRLREAFRGNIEGRDVCRGLVDVIVCDGFVGNIVLKCCEGMVEFLMREVSNELLGTLQSEREVAKTSLANLYSRYHYSEFGGAPLLGIDGVCLICHGASDAKAMRNAIRAAKRYNIVNKLIVSELETALASATLPAAV